MTRHTLAYEEDSTFHLLCDLNLAGKTRTRRERESQGKPLRLANGDLLDEHLLVLLGIRKHLRQLYRRHNMAEATGRT